MAADPRRAAARRRISQDEPTSQRPTPCPHPRRDVRPRESSASEQTNSFSPPAATPAVSRTRHRTYPSGSAPDPEEQRFRPDALRARPPTRGRASSSVPRLSGPGAVNASASARSAHRPELRREEARGQGVPPSRAAGDRPIEGHADGESADPRRGILARVGAVADPDDPRRAASDRAQDRARPRPRRRVGSRARRHWTGGPRCVAPRSRRARSRGPRPRSRRWSAARQSPLRRSSASPSGARRRSRRRRRGTRAPAGARPHRHRAREGRGATRPRRRALRRGGRRRPRPTQGARSSTAATGASAADFDRGVESIHPPPSRRSPR